MGRIYRQGQTKPCTIYRLFTSGTVEEIIYQRQTQKGGLSTLTVDAGTDKKSQRSSSSSENASKFTKEELADCFNLKERCACDTKAKVGNRWPDYDGSRDCLEASGCLDEPLLELVDSIADTLLYVHIASDKTVSDKLVEEDDVADDAASIVAFGSGVEDDNASVDNDSENEF
jgi:hypothetical protein